MKCPCPKYVGGATLYDEFVKYGINRCVQNKMALKYAKNHVHLFRHFEDASRRCEPSNVVAHFLANRVYRHI